MSLNNYRMSSAKVASLRSKIAEAIGSPKDFDYTKIVALLVIGIVAWYVYAKTALLDTNPKKFIFVGLLVASAYGAWVYLDRKPIF